MNSGAPEDSFARLNYHPGGFLLRVVLFDGSFLIIALCLTSATNK